PVQEQEIRRYHVMGKPRCQKATEFVDRGRLLSVRFDVSNQTKLFDSVARRAAPRKLFGDHCIISNSGTSAKHGLDLRQFYAETANTDSPIIPPNPFHIAIRQVPSKFAGSGKPIGNVVRKWINDKILSREIAIADVALS